MSVLITALILISSTFGQLTGREIMERVDAQQDPHDEISTTTMTLIKIVHGKERKRVREVKRYQKFYSGGQFETKSLIIFLKPADVKGTGFLMWEYWEPGKDDDQWLYLPALQKVKRIAAREKSESFMGTDFTYEDLGGRDIDEDTYRLLGEETVFGEDCYQVEAIPVQGSDSYSKRIVWVSKENWQPRKIDFYDRKGRLLKVLRIPEMHKDGEYWTVDRMVMENVQKSHKTVLEISEVEHDSGLNDDFFTQRILQRGK